MNKIIWHKWMDPLAPLVYNAKDEKDDEDELDDTHKKASTDSFLKPGEIAYRHDKKPENKPLGPCLVGPLGIVPLHEDNLPSAIWNFWMGHTNFGLTDGMVKRIKAVPGVEALNVYSPYRFRLAIAKAFDPRDVRLGIDACVLDKPEQEKAKTASGMEGLKLMLSKRHKHWAIYAMPSGRHECVGGETRKEVEEKGKRFLDAAKGVVKSW